MIDDEIEKPIYLIKKNVVILWEKKIVMHYIKAIDL
jgi:hypothetical protein